VRHRLVTEQDGQEHVGSLVVTLEEAVKILRIEAALHEATGWAVRWYGRYMIRASRNERSPRWVWVRSRTPLEDET
jgi:hypothetical protein